MTKDQSTFAISFFGALAIVGAFAYVLATSVGSLHKVATPPTAQAPKAIPQPVNGSVERPTSAIAAPTVIRGNRNSDVDAIYRCEIAGRVVYSDTKCPNVPIREVEMTINEGFLSPERQDTGPPRPAVASLSSEPSGRQFVEPGANNHAFECDLIDKAIMAIEEQARHPQIAQTQDRLTQEKRSYEQRKYDLKC